MKPILSESIVVVQLTYKQVSTRPRGSYVFNNIIPCDTARNIRKRSNTRATAKHIKIVVDREVRRDIRGGIGHIHCFLNPFGTQCTGIDCKVVHLSVKKANTVNWKCFNSGCHRRPAHVRLRKQSCSKMKRPIIPSGSKRRYSIWHRSPMYIWALLYKCPVNVGTEYTVLVYKSKMMPLLALMKSSRGNVVIIGAPNTNRISPFPVNPKHTVNGSFSRSIR
mmetsp:Transcript_30027/g.47693  ORF Transcript_30027/g.47693 Transcript_30027/m.47693 type:complete len:221 (+) Transcript_30027:6544-7206(+)